MHSHEHAELAIPIPRTEPHVVPALIAFQSQLTPRRFRKLLRTGDQFIQFGLGMLLHVLPLNNTSANCFKQLCLILFAWGKLYHSVALKAALRCRWRLFGFSAE